MRCQTFYSNYTFIFQNIHLHSPVSGLFINKIVHSIQLYGIQKLVPVFHFYRKKVLFVCINRRLDFYEFPKPGFSHIYAGHLKDLKTKHKTKNKSGGGRRKGENSVTLGSSPLVNLKEKLQETQYMTKIL